jgi:hypothetical protein
LLGEDYPGYFEVGDAGGLAQLLLQAEMDSGFLARLKAQVEEKVALFNPAREREAWRALLEEWRRGEE